MKIRAFHSRSIFLSLMKFIGLCAYYYLDWYLQAYMYLCKVMKLKVHGAPIFFCQNQSTRYLKYFRKKKLNFVNP